MPVAIVLDSTHYMPREVVERHGFHTVSLYVRWGTPPSDTREADLPDFDAFYDHLRSARELPSTSQPSVGDFLSVYEPLIERGDDILSIHLSGGISGTVHSAEQARDRAARAGRRAGAGRSCSTRRPPARATGSMAIAADNLAREGASLQEAAERAREARART